MLTVSGRLRRWTRGERLRDQCVDILSGLGNLTGATGGELPAKRAELPEDHHTYRCGQARNAARKMFTFGAYYDCMTIPLATPAGVLTDRFDTRVLGVVLMVHLCSWRHAAKGYPMRTISRTDRTPRNYERKFRISTHALDRFRERVDEEFRHRDDKDLGNLLDEKMRHSQERHQVVDPRAPDAVTLLYTIEMRLNGTFYTVVRDDTAITVLDPDMARRNFPAVWKPMSINTPFKALANLALPVRQMMSALEEAATSPYKNVAPLPAPTLVPPDPLADAGIRHARALKRRKECEAALVTAHADAKRAIDAATQALGDARDECQQAELELNAAIG